MTCRWGGRMSGLTVQSHEEQQPRVRPRRTKLANVALSIIDQYQGCYHF